MHSCLYHGHVQHRRLSPAKHVFRYGLYLAYLDLDELPALLDGKCGLQQRHICRRIVSPDGPPGRREPATGRRGGGPGGRADGAAAGRPCPAAHAPAQLGSLFQPAQPVLLLRSQRARRWKRVVAEVSNTPWLERHWYVLRRWQPHRRANSAAVPPRQGFSCLAISWTWTYSMSGTCRSRVSSCRSRSLIRGVTSGCSMSVWYCSGAS